MKYGIDGIEKSRIIKNIKIVNNGKVIEVKYLNGKKDIIEYSGDNFNRIKIIMMGQAKKYVGDYAKRLKEFLVAGNVMAVVSSLLFLAGVAGLFSGNLGFQIVAIVAEIFSLFTAIGAINIKKEIKYLKKYDLYLQDDFNKELDKYKDVMNKEKSLGKKLSKNEQKQVALKDITCLDNYSLEELKEIKEKIERYTSLVGENIEVPVLEEEKGKQKVKK